MLRILLVIASSLFFLAAPAFADTDLQAIKIALTKALPDVSISEIKPSPIAGVYEVVADLQVIYVTADGKFLLMGDLVDLGTRSNLSAVKRSGLIKHAVDAIGEENMVVMGPANAKHTITVFTDVDCPYCAKLHLEVPQLVKGGVKVRYLLYPRAGVGSDTYNRSVAAWCSKEPAKAIGTLKAGGKIEMKTCANPVKQHYELGQTLRISGTPTIVLDNGKIVPGYAPAANLLSMLGMKGDTATK
jgi:thiol:disulfide interchange protein DsbC